MENRSGWSCNINSNSTRQEEPKDESKEHGHVTSRQPCAAEGDVAGFMLNGKTDSLALLSVYRYAKKIKYFLGWEDIAEDGEPEKSCEDSAVDNLFGIDGSFSSEDALRTSPFEYEDKERNRYVCDANDKRSSIHIDVEDFYQHKDENENGASDERTIFRSEVSLNIGDCRTNKAEALITANDSAESLARDSHNIDIKMDNSLCKTGETTDEGLHLNDEHAILRDETALYTNSSNNNFGITTEGDHNGSDEENKPDNNGKDTGIEDETSDNALIDKHETDECEVSNKAESVTNGGKSDGLPEVTPKANGNFSVGDSPRSTPEINSNVSKSNNAHVSPENGKKKESELKEKTYNDKPNMCNKQSYDDDAVCGLACFKPRWLQSYATANVYVVLYSIIGILHGSYYSYLIGSLSTLEKRFAFKSKSSGIIMVVDEITPLLLGIFVGYYATKAHRPRIVAFGMFLSALCCFCTCLPYFIYGSMKDLVFQTVQNRDGPEYCDANSETDSCDSPYRPQGLIAVLLLMFGSFLKGFGNLAYYAIGLAYLDDNSDKKSTPIYLAISLALRLLGPLLGFVMSYGFLKLYENPNDDPGFGPEDPRWIGAWWIGFFLQGVLLFIFTLPIALFPKRLPGQKKIEKNDSRDSSNSSKEIFRGLLAALKRLGKNPVFIVLILNTTMKIFGHFGHAIMLPKYMENQFRLSASQASLYSGATSITCIILATLIGGYLIWKFRPKIKVILAGMIGAEICLVIGYLILMIPRCQPLDMMHFGMDDEGLVLNSVCNVNCDCSTTSFTPFCGPDGTTTYFSPCHAGCTEEFNSSESPIKNKIFGNCSCVAYKHSEISTITEGFCADDNCWTQRLFYLLVLLVLVTISNIFTVAHTMILLRSVHPADKSFALGTFETFICLFGFIPFPVTFGALVDSACLVWEKSCGETGNCWFYDMEKYSYLLHGVAASFCSLSVVCLITLYFLSPRIRNLYEEEEESEIVDIKLDTVSGGSITKL